MATETTTTCDKCKQKCVNGMVRFNATTTHWTNRREEVGEDYYKPLELCLTCGGVAVEVLGMTHERHQDYARDSDGPSILPCDSPVAIAPPISLGGIELHRRGPVDEVGPQISRASLVGELT